MTRRQMRSAWGSVAEVERGVWRLRYWGTDAEGRYRRMSRTVRGTRRDAERLRSELMLAHSEDAPCPTVGVAWEQWHLPHLRARLDAGELSQQTMRQYESTWRRHVAPRWSETPCDAVLPLDVQQWLSEVGRSAAVASLALMRPLMDHAVRYGFAQSNPMRERYLLPPRSTASAMDRGVWSLAELREVWGVVRGEWFEPAFLLAAFGGLRVGEALGVQGADVTASNGCALVEVRRQVPNRGEPTERLKNPQSRRAVAVPGRAGAALIAASAEPSWLSGDGLGGWQSQVALGRSWERALAGMPEGLRHPFRNLRNSWETNARWALGLDSWGIEVMLGHKAPGVTGSHYDRPRADMVARVVADAYSAAPYDADWDEFTV